MKDKTKSILFDFIQIASIIYFVLTGPIFASYTFVLIMEIIGVSILLIAAWEMRRTRYYRVPDTGKQNELVTNGIYAYIRNPMYLAQIIIAGCLLFSSFSFFRFIIYLIFIVNFLFKIRYEERLLTKYFKSFLSYKRHSWRLIPYIY